MPWLSAFFLLLLSLLIGWIPVLGPLALGVLAARAEPGPRAPLALLPALSVQTLGLLATRALTNAVQDSHLDGWVWTAVSWLLSPQLGILGTALGRPFRRLVADSSAVVFLLVFTFPVLLGLLLGALYRAR